jgi:hypothetical protein
MYMSSRIGKDMHMLERKRDHCKSYSRTVLCFVTRDYQSYKK